MTDHYAVIGNPIDHSLSPTIHHYFASQMHKKIAYEKILGDEEAFEKQVLAFFKSGGKGLNITLPFKQRAFILASHFTPRCLKAKSANTLWMHNSALWADNTDGIGLMTDLSRYINLDDKHVLILGAGGAVHGIIEPLLMSNIANLTIVNRTQEKLVRLSHDFPKVSTTTLEKLSAHFDLIINATSASLTGVKMILPVALLKNKPLCYDLSYAKNQATPFVKFAKDQGCQAYDGLGMLVEQAAESFLIWQGVKPDTGQLLQHLSA